MKTSVGEYLAWLFYPGRFFRAGDSRRALPLADFETLYFVDRSHDLRTVNRTTGKTFLGGRGNEFLSVLLGPQSVFLLDHERHRLARKVMGGVLTKSAADEHTPVVDRIVNDEIDRIRGRRRVNVGAWARFVTMRVVCHVSLGLDDIRRIRRLYDSFEATTGFLANIVSFRKGFWRDRGPLSVGGYAALLVRRIDRQIYAMIRSRREELARRDSSEEGAGTALDALLEAQSEHGYDDAFIRDNLVALLAAGYDTTGSALTWMCHWLSHEPGRFVELIEAQTRGEHSALENFRNEVLRYCPPIDILPRRIDGEFYNDALEVIPELRDVDAGEDGPMVCPHVHRVHHDPSVYSRPECFDPDRFDGARRLAGDEYMPFGAGMRMCLGLNFGKLVMDRVLVAFAGRRVRFEVSTRRFRPVRRNVSIWPAFSVRGRLIECG